MYTYKRVIRCRHMMEVEVYNSIKKVGKNYGGRKTTRKLSAKKQRIANQLRAVRHWEQLIDCNFDEQDYFCRFSAPFGTFCDEQQFMRHIGNWFKRIKRQTDKLGITFKYIGFRECGKLGKNWHLHIILSADVVPIAMKCWYYPNGGINLTPLWQNRNYEKLAQYIRKDLTEKKIDGTDDGLSHGGKRMMASRNLARPEISVTRCSRREVRRLERGEWIEPPQGFYLDKDEITEEISDITGAAYYFKYRSLAFPAMKNRRF